MLTRIPIKLLRFIALGFGSGLAPFAPGTFGTLVAIPLVLLLDLLPVFWQVCIILVAYWLGVKICDLVAKQLNQADPSQIVWDEIVGFMITMLLIPLTLWSILLGFLLFRLLDILKPFPISYFDKHLIGGKGIMFDDLLAGVFAWIILQAIMRFGWYF